MGGCSGPPRGHPLSKHGRTLGHWPASWQALQQQRRRRSGAARVNHPSCAPRSPLRSHPAGVMRGDASPLLGASGGGIAVRMRGPPTHACRRAPTLLFTALAKAAAAAGAAAAGAAAGAAGAAPSRGAGAARGSLAGAATYWGWELTDKAVHTIPWCSEFGKYWFGRTLFRNTINIIAHRRSQQVFPMPTISLLGARYPVYN
eukprot:gene17698-biopygen11400